MILLLTNCSDPVAARVTRLNFAGRSATTKNVFKAIRGEPRRQDGRIEQIRLILRSPLSFNSSFLLSFFFSFSLFLFSSCPLRIKRVFQTRLVLQRKQQSRRGGPAKPETDIQSGYRRSRSYHGTNWVTEDRAYRGNPISNSLFFSGAKRFHLFIPDNRASLSRYPTRSLNLSPQLWPVCNYPLLFDFPPLLKLMIPRESHK